MATAPIAPPAAPVQTPRPAPQIPPLENGDRLARPEFERRYHAMPHLKKAELLEGVVHVGSPVSTVNHAQPHARVVLWAGSCCMLTPGVEVGDNGTMRLDLDNEPQPDVFLWRERGGQAHIDADGYLSGAPEVAVEIASSSASYDLHVKLNVYRKHGVREYVVWRVLDRAIDWFVLREGHYEALPPGEDGVYRSEVFPGLWLPAEAMLAGDRRQVFAALQQGAATPEHALFVESLREAASGRGSESPAP